MALAFFRWYCHPSLQEEIEGDLLERFQHYANIHGHSKAKWLFIKETVLLFRPSIARNIFQRKDKYIPAMITPTQRLTGIVLAVALLLLVPLIAMQFTTEVSWTLFDFVVAGGLLLSTGLLCEFTIRKVKKSKNRIAICATIISALLIIWAELAVGIFN